MADSTPHRQDASSHAHDRHDLEPAVQAQPYPHQVGGHGQLAITKPGQVLKPLVEKEKRFYQYIHSGDLPPDLHWIREVTPKFYGEFDYPHATTPTAISVSPQHPCSNNPTVNSNHNFNSSTDTTTTTANPLTNSSICTNLSPSSSPASGCTLLHRPDASPVPQWRSVHDGDSHQPTNISPWAAQMRLKMQMRPVVIPTPTSVPIPTSSSSVTQPISNPHSGSSAKEDTYDIFNESGNNKPLKRRPSRSIALEDINRKFIIPCVLDCKIGVRHYDDDATPEKRRRHTEKANRTTTAKCGVRYTGMQSFKRMCRDNQHGIYETANKYDGRKLKETDLVPEATWFFHDGFDVQRQCVAMTLDRLISLRARLLHQHHFFFYSSSLLLVYEGAAPSIAPPRVEVRMIDFAHTIRSNGQRDNGYLKGLNYLIHILSQILLNEQANQRCLPVRVTQAHRNGHSANGTDSEQNPQLQP